MRLVAMARRDTGRLARSHLGDGTRSVSRWPAPKRPVRSRGTLRPQTSRILGDWKLDAWMLHAGYRTYIELQLPNGTRPPDMLSPPKAQGLPYEDGKN